ncbi:MAG: hypothetical protein NZM04_00290, partial [Methylacidiphilales bacterium]|nr:hypothetical protein [Candidatus Methylacidiphilales bacterium]
LRSHIKHRKHKEKIAPASPKRQPPSPHPILSHVLIAKLSIHKSARLHQIASQESRNEELSKNHVQKNDKLHNLHHETNERRCVT